ncbi:MAG: response regulator transcription factor [Myxococcaceae bacterium]
MEANGEVRVTILEDQSLMRESLKEVLEHGGLHVVGQYGDPGEFLAHVAVDVPRVAIIDLGLLGPGGRELTDGLSVVKEVRTRHPDVQTLVFSGHAEPETVAMCYREGAAGFLDKLSADGTALVNAVRVVARGERLFPVHLLEAPTLSVPPAPISPLLQSLSAREREVLTYVAAGADNLKIATLLRISERTVKAHVSSLYRKLGAENRTRLALCALQLGVRPSSDV